MKLVIDIPEEHYNSIVSGHDIEIYYGEHFVTKDSWASELIRKGTLLEQEPKTGHWIKGIEEDWNGEDEFIEEYLECDQCHYRYSDGLIAYNFCPNCGAKMAETEDKNA